MRNRFHLTLLLVALALCRPAALRSETAAPDSKLKELAADPSLADGLNKVVTYVRGNKLAACRTAFERCRKGCEAGNSDCGMGCEMDCSACAYQDAGVLNAKECE